MAADNNASRAAQEMMLEVPTIRHKLQSDNGVLEDLLESCSLLLGNFQLSCQLQHEVRDWSERKSSKTVSN